METGEIRDGRRANTTAETISWYRNLISELDQLIVKTNVEDGAKS
jgi:hypothetical protein